MGDIDVDAAVERLRKRVGAMHGNPGINADVDTVLDALAEAQETAHLMTVARDRGIARLEARAEAAEAERDRLEDDVEMLSKDAMKFARERDAAEAKLARIAELHPRIPEFSPVRAWPLYQDEVHRIANGGSES